MPKKQHNQDIPIPAFVREFLTGLSVAQRRSLWRWMDKYSWDERDAVIYNRAGLFDFEPKDRR